MEVWSCKTTSVRFTAEEVAAILEAEVRDQGLTELSGLDSSNSTLHTYAVGDELESMVVEFTENSPCRKVLL